ncbi:hypothetical protein Mal64_36150 [Pseudobythopirellula maris]|uniref:Uncharacterized protein n=1 Tax=Pseudobythopirellula maris TaxID=2527991 RepID=A0A5C5ZI39_9BACT|nr:hypothetical protein [Pseudobythopirellula maris]TWT86785.1 hypothetical protein Mal64_36150 [Pseudobythopirellula maris]
MFQAILDSIRFLLTGGASVIADTLMWFWGNTWGMVQNLLDLVGMPAISFPAVPIYVSASLNTANHWFPVNEGLALLAAYWTFYLLSVPIKIILRHIPFAGG